MYERMLDKLNEPTSEAIQDHIGETSTALLHSFEDALKLRYDLQRDLKFPFGNNYGWGYTYSHKTKHLCYVFFEKEAITILLQLGGNLVSKLEKVLPACLSKTKDYWEHRYPCGDGGWIHYRVLTMEELNDVIKLLAIKQKPVC